MLIIGDLSAEIPDTNAHHWDLGAFSQDDSKNVLAYGYHSTINPEILSVIERYDKRAFFNNWAPCEFSQIEPVPNLGALEYEDKYDIIYSICPYTNRWLNKKSLGREYRDIFYPYNKKLIPKTFDKEYDVIYHGGIHGQEHIDCLSVMMGFNYRYCTMTHHINQTTATCIPYATNLNLSFQDKINLIAKAKISICYNIVHVSPKNVPVIKSHDKWNDNEAFQEIEKTYTKPQFKTRMHEAAISRTLNLVYKDSWRVGEKHYEPDKDFIYFDNPRDLREKIDDISNNWENYSHIVESAFKKSQKYTVENFVDFIREDIQK